MKITKLLPIVVALAMTTSGVFAAVEKGANTVGESSNATAEYQLNLAEYLKITTTTTPQPSTVSFADDYVSATIDTALAGGFTVISNKVSKDIYLQGSAITSGDGSANALYSPGSDPSKLKLVFTNQSHQPANTAVTNITGGSPVLASNPDAIAFAITATSTHDNFPDDGITPSWDADKKQVKYTIKNGTSVFGYSISGTNEANTFDTHDTDGIYKATLTMTDTSL